MSEQTILSPREQWATDFAQRREDEAIEGALRHFLEHPDDRTDSLLEWRHVEVLIRQIDRLRGARGDAFSIEDTANA